MSLSNRQLQLIVAFAERYDLERLIAVERDCGRQPLRLIVHRRIFNSCLAMAIPWVKIDGSTGLKILGLPVWVSSWIEGDVLIETNRHIPTAEEVQARLNTKD